MTQPSAPRRKMSLRNLRLVLLAVGVASCSQDAAGPPDGGSGHGGSGEPPSPMNVSNPRSLSSVSLNASSSIAPGTHATVGGVRSMSVSVDANVAYISLQPQTFAGGSNAVITNRRSGATLTAPIVDGGIDPVQLSATAGDSVVIEAITTSGVTIGTVSNVVPDRRPPTIVRSSPGRGKTGVPLNKNIEVVFTEPVAPSSVGSSIQLFHGNTQVSGSAQILQGATASIVFKPTANLVANTNYELVVTKGVQDLDGDAVDSVTRIPFTTGTSIEGPIASLSLIPDGVDIRVGDQFQAAVIAKDVAGNIITGHAVRWFVDSTALNVTSTGLVTGQHEGFGTLFAEVEGFFYLGYTGVRVSNALHTVASVIVAFDSGSVSAGGTLQVAAIATDADGNLLPRRLIQWSTSNSAVATVAATTSSQASQPGWFHGQQAPPSAIYSATITAVANGVARIAATIEGQSDTVVVTVAPSFSVTDFVLSTDTATLLLHQTAQFPGFSVNSAGGRTSVSATQIQWESSNSAVATVDASGTVTGISAGSATITGHWSNYSSSARVTIVQVAFESMSAGYAHTCALATGGATYCWGSNDLLQVGKPGVSNLPAGVFYPTPMRVASGFTFASIIAGGSQSCGLTAANAAYCWGYNWAGALGSNSFDESSQPLAVSGGFTFVEVVAGGSHTCGITSGGSAYCWGWNNTGQLGISGLAASSIPRAVSGGITFATLTAGGSHTCGLTADGTAYCWGWNADAQLGTPPRTDGNVPSIDTPQPVSGGLTFASITAGGAHTCGLTGSGSVYCWGSNGNGQLGSGVLSAPSAVPVQVASNLNFIAVFAGLSHTCAIDSGGAAYCWGWNRNGQVGVGVVSDAGFATPQRVVGGFTFDRLSVAGSHSCARTTTGVWYCWGDNESGALGVGTTTDSGTPLKVLGQQ